MCIRLWDEDEQLLESTPPEINEADLAPLVLELSLWYIYRLNFTILKFEYFHILNNIVFIFTLHSLLYPLRLYSLDYIWTPISVFESF